MWNLITLQSEEKRGEGEGEKERERERERGEGKVKDRGLASYTQHPIDHF